MMFAKSLGRYPALHGCFWWDVKEDWLPALRAPPLLAEVVPPAPSASPVLLAEGFREAGENVGHAVHRAVDGKLECVRPEEPAQRVNDCTRSAAVRRCIPGMVRPDLDQHPFQVTPQVRIAPTIPDRGPRAQETPVRLA